jgi:hypothetical protein
VLYAVQEPFHKALLTGKTTHAAWRSKPSYYAVSTEDRTINPDLERFMAKRMGAKIIEVKASHLANLPSRQNHTADPRSRGPASLTSPAHAQHERSAAPASIFQAVRSQHVRVQVGCRQDRTTVGCVR